MSKYISSILLFSILFLGEACTSTPKTQDSNIVVTHIFSFEKWIDEKCEQHLVNEPKSTLIKEAFSIFQERVYLYISENTEYSIEFLNEEKDWKEYSDNIKMGYISLKSLEQILNMEIMKHNTENEYNRINTITIDYPSEILSIESKERLKRLFTQIDELDIKKKEKKQKFHKFISNEILNNYSLEIEKQNIFSQF